MEQTAKVNPTQPSPEPARLGTLAALFLRLGCTAFGGPAAHTAMMYREVVERRAWFSPAEFLDLVGATNLIPGPNSTELAMHIGQQRAGWKGLLVAGMCFIFPAVACTLILAHIHAVYGQLPSARPTLMGIQAALVPVILLAIAPLARKSFGYWWSGAICLLSVFAAAIGLHELLIMAIAGFLAATVKSGILPQGGPSARGWLPLSAIGTLAAPGTIGIFLSFLKVGAILYGSGYVLFAFLDSELVATGMLAREDLSDAIAAGQMTPGPVFSAATFVGFRMGGWAGAAAATIGIFLPAFLFVAALRPLTQWLRSSKWFEGFLDGVNAASIGLVAWVCWDMAQPLLLEWQGVIVLWWSLLLQIAFPKLNSVWVILGGAMAGALLPG